MWMVRLGQSSASAWLAGSMTISKLASRSCRIVAFNESILLSGMRNRGLHGKSLLVRHAGRDVIELFADGRRYDHCAADVDPMVADAGVGLEGKHHSRLQHGLALTCRVGADITNIELDLVVVDLRAAGQEMWSD